MKKLLNLAKQLKAVSGLITSIIVIAGVVRWVDTRDVKRNESEELRHTTMMDSIADMKEMVFFNNVQIGQLGERQEGFHNTLIEFEEEHEGQGKSIEILDQSVKTLGWAIENINNVSPEMMEEILDRELKKNSGLMPMKKEELEWPAWWIVPPSTELILSSEK